MAVKQEVKLILSAQDKASLAVRNVRSEFGVLESATRKLMLALGPLAGAFAVREIIDAAMGWERYNLALKTVFGSQEAANQEIAWLKGIADDLGLNVEGLASSYSQLAASTKDTALEGAATRDIFFAISGAMAKLGKDSNDTSGALLAISQMISKGKVSAEELRQQLGERMPGAFKLFADSMGVSTAELDKMLASGEVLAKDVLPGFAEEVKRAFDVNVGDRLDTANAAMGRFNNSLLELKLTVAESGVLASFTSSIEAIEAAISDGGLLENISLLGGMISSIGDDGNGTELFFKSLIEILKVFGVGVMTVLAPVKLLGEIIGATAAAISLAVEGEFALAQAALMDSGPADKFNEDIGRIETAVANLGSSFETMGDDAKQAAPKVAENKKEIKSAGDEAATAADKTKLAAQASKDDAKAKEQQAKMAHEAALASGKLAVEMAKIDSNERIKTFEVAVDFKIEKVKAEADVMKSIIDNVGTAITSTGDLLGSLSSSLGSASGFQEKWTIEDLIRDENDRRDDAFEMQRDLTDAQLDLIDAKTRALKSGDALIKISGDGLAPELEAFMWKILESIQIRAAEDQSSFLLGI